MVIDGGFSTQLTTHVSDSVDKDPLWTARYNSTHPELVIKTHLDFLKAGANAILTNTYQASVEGYVKHMRLSPEESINLIKATVRLAHEARSRFLSDRPNCKVPWIVGSIGPYGAHLHDGSEYTGNYADTIDPEVIKNWHRVRMEAILEAGVDALAIETIPCKVSILIELESILETFRIHFPQMEADIILALIAAEFPNTKFWISLQCRDNRTLAHGETFAETVIDLWNKSKKNGNHDKLIALGVNCTQPANVVPLFKSVNGARSPADRIPLIVYPNSGEIFDTSNG